jgi:heme o synthase
MSSVAAAVGTYRELSKSGIVALVLISVLGGYLIGQPAESPLDFARMVLTLLGILLLASGSSALNQIQEREIDAKMPRTAQRPLPSGRIELSTAVVFTAVCIVSGLALLGALGTELLALGMAAVVFYNGFYTLWWKRRWAYAAVPGAVPGALPILMGHAASSGTVLDPGGVFLFMLLFFWQMPHFWVLALRYREDYRLGEVPTLPVRHGAGVTVSQIALWCLAYVGLGLLGPLFLKVGPAYLAVALALTAKLLWELRSFMRQPESKRWLRFFLWVNFSLILYVFAAAADLWAIHLQPYFR